MNTRLSMTRCRDLYAALKGRQSTLRTATGITIVLYGASMIISGVTSIAMARLLGVQELSFLILFNVGIMTVALFSDVLGAYNANIYMIANGDHDFSLSTIRGTALVYGLVSGAVVGVVLGFSPLRRMLFPQFVSAAWGLRLALAVCGYAMLRQISAVFTGQRDFLMAGLTTLLQFGLYAGMALVATLVLGWKTGEQIASVQLVSVFCCVALCLIPLGRGGIARPSLAYLKRCSTVGKRALVTNWLGFLHTRVDQYLVNWMYGPAALAFYAVAVSLGEMLTRVPGMMGAVVFPLVAAEKNHATLVRQTLRQCLLTMAVVFAISIPIAIFANQFVTLLYGKRFAQSVPALQVLLPSIVFMSGLRIVENHLSGIGYPAIKQLAAAFSLGVNLIANLLLLPRLGILGASLASSISYLLWLLIMVGYLWRQDRRTNVPPLSLPQTLHQSQPTQATI